MLVLPREKDEVALKVEAVGLRVLVFSFFSWFGWLSLVQALGLRVYDLVCLACLFYRVKKLRLRSKLTSPLLLPTLPSKRRVASWRSRAARAREAGREGEREGESV